MEPTQQGSLPFLDTLVPIQPDSTFSTTVYRKPTHTDQYLHWDSNNHIAAKQSVYNTLTHRAKVVSSTQDSLDKELQHIETALQACQFPQNALNQWHYRFINNNQQNNYTNNDNNTNQDNSHTNNPTRRNITLVVPYTKGISENSKDCAKQKEYKYTSKGNNTLRTQLVNPKDKDPNTNKSGITGGSHLSWSFWEHENLSGLSVIWLIYIKLHKKREKNW